MSAPQKIPYSIVDAFATGPFTGNPACVVVLQDAVSDELMIKIAREINQPMTAFVTPSDDASVDYRLRWFTAHHEERLCGHATLATLHALFSRDDVKTDSITFTTRGGLVRGAKLSSGDVELDFPADDIADAPAGSDLRNVCEKTVSEVFGNKAEVVGVVKGRMEVVLVELKMQDGIRLKDMEIVGQRLEAIPASRAVILTTANPDLDTHFHSRVFNPLPGFPEDAATGSTNCVLGPYYARRVASAAGADVAGFELRASQGGPKRGGAMRVAWDGKLGSAGGQVKIRGKAVIVAEGTFFV